MRLQADAMLSKPSQLWWLAENSWINTVLQCPETYTLIKATFKRYHGSKPQTVAPSLL